LFSPLFITIVTPHWLFFHRIMAFFYSAGFADDFDCHFRNLPTILVPSPGNPIAMQLTSLTYIICPKELKFVLAIVQPLTFLTSARYFSHNPHARM
jgi:hypothetical protein